MPRIRWSVGATVAGLPALEASGSANVEAVSKLEVPVEEGETPTAGLHAGSADDVVLLCVAASRYDAGVSYELGGRTLTLDRPHLFGGAMIGQLFNGDGDLEQFAIVDPAPTKPVTVTVLVGRDALDTDNGD